MRRRKFLGVLGGAASWPVVARAQAQSTPVVGLLGPDSAHVYGRLIAALNGGLSEGGLKEGVDVRIIGAWADSQMERLPALAAELGKRAAVIVTFGGSRGALAAKQIATKTSIVFVVQDDPVKIGLVTSFNRPGANVTGLATLTAQLDAKRLALLGEAVPQARVFGAFINPGNPDAHEQEEEIRAVAAKIGVTIVVAKVRTEQEVDAALDRLRGKGVQALLVASDPLFRSLKDRVLLSVARSRLPTIYHHNEYVLAGGFMSYGPDLGDVYRQAGLYAARILKGEKPRDLPVLQPTKFELTLNLKAAKALGLVVPPTLLARADEVIE